MLTFCELDWYLQPGNKAFIEAEKLRVNKERKKKKSMYKAVSGIRLILDSCRIAVVYIFNNLTVGRDKHIDSQLQLVACLPS